MDPSDCLPASRSLGLAPELETSFVSLASADMREAKEVEGLGLPFSPRCASFGRKATELDQAGFLRMQFQRELRQSPLQIFEEL
jgi:hypothetical protein